MKYLGVKIDEYLTWKPHIDGISAKLNKINAVLSIIRHSLRTYLCKPYNGLSQNSSLFCH